MSQTSSSQMLVPSLQASDLQQGLTDYLTTTFSLTETDTRQALENFLTNADTGPEDETGGSGIFKGPYIRTRLPFAPAPDNWEDRIDWVPSDFTPYGHQGASFVRLSSKPEPENLGVKAASPQATWRHPQPTMVTTGTGSGKTESFMIPIIDHVLRANHQGITGTKALILYPMNALANDQAQRLARYITENHLPITAGIYTGENNASSNSTVTSDQLITDRGVMRENAPDILLTNYKMLDMLLLRSADANIWKESAYSLQYLVLDEFHTYDGAQGTDVAMLLRRLGLTLKNHWISETLGDVSDNPLENPHGITKADLARPLGKITPVATSATLGAKGDPEAMLTFAHTIFGEEFPANAVITESRMSREDWFSHLTGVGDPPENAKDLTSMVYTASEVFQDVQGNSRFDFTKNPDYLSAAELSENLGLDGETYALGALKHPGLRAAMYDDFVAEEQRPQELIPVTEFLSHEYVQAIIEHTQNASDIFELSTAIVPANKRPVGEHDPQRIRQLRISTITTVLSGLSVIRKHLGRGMPTIEIHQWVRELSRINRKVGTVPSFSWSAAPSSADGDDELFLPAIFCRNCGRSGWGIKQGKIEGTYDVHPARIREASVRNSGDFRPLIYAPVEGEKYASDGYQGREELWWFHIDSVDMSRDGKTLTDNFESEAWENNRIIPVLSYTGLESVSSSKSQVCPACNAKDSIRFVGSAIATMLSVTISTLFGSSNITADEKKALVFTDSVQDAAHRAGFIQARSHSMTLRAAFKTALESMGADESTVAELAEQAVTRAETAEERYQLLDPSIAGRRAFKPFWSQGANASQRRRARTRAQKRLAFDAVMEFGLNSRMGRTLELTGSVAAAVDYGSEENLLSLIDNVLQRSTEQLALFSPLHGDIGRTEKMCWITGVLERIRMQGGIYHPWLEKFIGQDGATWFLQGGRAKKEGMPGFGGGRPMPAFPRIGEETTRYSGNLDNVTHHQSWYTLWTARSLQTSATNATHIIKNIFEALAEEGILNYTVPKKRTGSGQQAMRAKIFWIDPQRIKLITTSNADLEQKKLQVCCSVCKMTLPGTPTTIAHLTGAPCFVSRCHGVLEPIALNPKNYYRGLYSSPDTLRVVAREHTSLLPTTQRLEFENGFKGRGSTATPDSPNVLVATPTLEMGIDIGDLSTVMLSSLPKTVANYQQRIGRAGRQTGNALVLTYVRGVGENLHKLANPLETINGEVRPPATFLNAEEMLRRQYIASIVDYLAAHQEVGNIPSSATLFSQANNEGNLLYKLKQSKLNADFFVNRFINQFEPLLTDEAASTLRSWAHDQIEDYIVDVQRIYNRDIDELKERISTLKQLIPELQNKVELYQNVESPEKVQAESELRKAQANQRFFTKQIRSLYDTHWPSTLELYGVLPNYTLLDDSVELSVGVTSWDPETSERDTTVESYVRGASTALSEFAPGNTFYANSLEVKIDAVDLGPNQSNVQRWQICHNCGWSTTLAQEATLVPTCVQCQSSIGDVSHVFDVVELQKVSADIERDEATISDRSDDRRRKFFTITSTMSTDPNHMGRRWSVAQPDFGVDPLKRVTLRWLNLGPFANGGIPRLISGKEYNAPLFRLCPECGVLDKDGERNSKDEHRFWCSLRKELEDHSHKIALGRTLITQGVQLHLPASLQYDGGLAVPSLKAAVLLGMRAVIGGQPDHIDVMDLHQKKQGQMLHSLLLHDKVPGGTGYLSEFGTPEKVWEVLKTAYLKLLASECTCQTACHQCLLPFAPTRDAEVLSKQAAINALRLLLNLGTEQQISADSSYSDYWNVQEMAYQPASSPESWLESKFSYVLAQRLAANGTNVRTVARDSGNELNFKIRNNGKTYQWLLTPQPTGYQGTRPDFRLSTPNPNIKDILIYLDSQRWHSTADAMRVTDDALKRQQLREQKEIVWSVTHDDIKAFESGTNLSVAPGISQQAIDSMQSKEEYSLNRAMIDLLQLDAVSMLWEWINNPDTAKWERFSQILPMYFLANSWKEKYRRQQAVHHYKAYKDVDGELNSQINQLFAPDGSPQSQNDPQANDHNMWGNRSESRALSLYFDLARGKTYPQTALFLRHDEDESHTESYQEDWRLWLRYSNLFAFHPDLVVGTSKAVFIDYLDGTSDTGDDTASVSPTELAQTELSEEWTRELDTYDQKEDKNLIDAFTTYVKADTRIPDFGYEYGDGAPVIYWEETDTVLYIYDEEHEKDEHSASQAQHLLTAWLGDREAVMQAVREAINLQ